MYNLKFHTQDLSKYKFLITGGAGFVGSNIVEYLLKNNASEVRVLDNLSNGHIKNTQIFEQYKNYTFIEGDITDYDTCIAACKDIDYISHQAALGSVPRSIKMPLSTHGANVNGFINMLVAAKETGVKRMVFASSSSVYGDSKTMPKVEDNIGDPLSPYAASKRIDEIYADVFSKVYGMELIGLRYFNIFGPRQNPNGAYAAVIPLFCDAVLNEKVAYINGDGEQTRDFTFVENAVQANVKAIFTEHNKACGQIYNIALGDRVSVNELYNILKENAGASVNAKYREEREGDVRDSLANISKARERLGYDPQVNVRKGLGITLDWYKIGYFDEK